MIPGEILTPDETIELSPGRPRVALAVENGPAFDLLADFHLTAEVRLFAS